MDFVLCTLPLVFFRSRIRRFRRLYSLSFRGKREFGFNWGVSARCEAHRSSVFPMLLRGQPSSLSGGLFRRLLLKSACKGEHVLLQDRQLRGKAGSRAEQRFQLEGQH